MEEISIPKNIYELKISKQNYLDKITISSMNLNFKWTNNGLLLGKSIENSDIFDLLLFASRNIEQVIIPSYIKCIQKHCFKNCTKLKNVEFAENSELCSIEDYAFENTSIEYIEIPPLAISIRTKTFFNCIQLKTISFHTNCNIQTICDSSFESSSIEEISIHQHVKYIGSRAFYNCKNLKHIEFPENSSL